MEPLEKMSHEEAKRIIDLMNKISMVIEEGEYTYQDVMRAIDTIKRNFEKKGIDLLNNTSIQEVAEYGAVLS